MSLDTLVISLKNRTLKEKFWISLVIVSLSAFLLVYSFMELLDYNPNIHGYFIFTIMATMLICIIIFMVTCIVAIIIVLFDKKFRMRDLYIVTYEYMGKTLLNTSVFTFLMVFKGIEINSFTCRLITNILNGIFIFQYYKSMTKIVKINKLPALIVIMSIVIFNVFIGFYFK